MSTTAYYAEPEGDSLEISLRPSSSDEVEMLFAELLAPAAEAGTK